MKTRSQKNQKSQENKMRHKFVVSSIIPRDVSGKNAFTNMSALGVGKKATLRLNASKTKTKQKIKKSKNQT